VQKSKIKNQNFLLAFTLLLENGIVLLVLLLNLTKTFFKKLRAIFSKIIPSKQRKTMPFFSTGVTLIETLVVIAIGILLISITFYSFSSLQNNTSLQKDVAQAKSILEEARYLSISEKNDHSYGVHLQSNGFVSFKGSVYNSADIQNNTQLFDEALIDNISLNGGGSEIIFNKITGTTNTFGTFRIKTLKDLNKNSTIRIAKTGIISEEQ